MHQHSSGFTMIELLVSVTLVGILTALSVVMYEDYKLDAERGRSLYELHNIHIAVVALESDTNLSPGATALDPCVVVGPNNEMAVDDCDAGLVCTDGDFPNWGGPYLSAGAAIDPWGTAYQYDQDYQCNVNVTGCKDHAGAWVKAVNTAGPDLVLNNYDAGEAAIVICAN